MTQSSALRPIAPTNRLAGTPGGEPRYSVTAQLRNGEAVTLGDPTATRAMVALMDMQAVMGGAASHFGGPSAFAELMSATFGYMFGEARQAKRPWYELFHMINDAGHCENGLYALKANYGFADLSLDSLRGFRSIESNLTGHGEAHLFPEGVYLSNGPLGSSIGPAQGLCLADRVEGVDRVTVTAISDGACMEGEARECLASIPGMSRKGQLNPFVLMISDNNTKLSGRIDEQSFSMAPTFASMKEFGWSVLEVEDGHDLQACLTAIEEAVAQARKSPERPVAIHAKTIKGKGVKKTEESSSGGHGFPLKDPKDLRAFLLELYHGQGQSIPEEFLRWCEELENLGLEKASQKKEEPEVPKEKIQVGLSQAMIEKRRSGFPVVSVSADLPGSTGVAAFHKDFPDSSFDVGVAEANMVSVGAGLSKQGFIPVVDTFAQFGVTKGALPLVMSSLSQAPVIAVFSHTGFQDAADGASHQALSFFAMTASIPHTDAYSLTCSEEAQALMSQAVDYFADEKKAGRIPRSQIFFLGRENFSRRYKEGMNYKLGQAQVLGDNTKDFERSVTLVAPGSLLPQAIFAAKQLAEDGVGSVVVNPSIINYPDTETLGDCLKKTDNYLLTVEEHQISGGFGGILAQSLLLSHHSPKMASLGVRDEFGQSAYKADHLYHKHQIDALAIVQEAQTLLSR